VSLHLGRVNCICEAKTWAQQIAAKTQEETCLNQMAKDIEEIKAASNLSNTEIKEIKTAIHQIPKTYANAVANTNTEATPLMVQARVKRREMQEKLRKEREPYEIVLTTSNKETIEKLNTMHGRKITEQCQNTIDKSNATDKWNQ